MKGETLLLKEIVDVIFMSRDGKTMDQMLVYRKKLLKQMDC